jgi:hypothetical protein
MEETRMRIALVLAAAFGLSAAAGGSVERRLGKTMIKSTESE